ncbi:MAG: hypothetical protein ACE5E6_11520, partial [Phycisphaerae bacterium]
MHARSIVLTGLVTLVAVSAARGWDDRVGSVAGVCGPGNENSCCWGWDTFTPGCDDVACCEEVCAFDPFCCAVLWDQICAGEALGLCDVCAPVCGNGACQANQNCATCPEDCGDCDALSFTPGHVFVVQPDWHCCELVGFDRIWEVDPETGDVQLFGVVEGQWCACMTGLAFTPDGRFLRVSMPFTNQILEFDAAGHFVVVLDGDDGIRFPTGRNNLAYDAEGAFYVINQGALNILRFPADGGPPSVFADSADGVTGVGALASVPDGDIYYAADQGDVLRITPDGDVSTFIEDSPTFFATSLAADGCGLLYVGYAAEGAILQFHAGDPASGVPIGLAPSFTTTLAMCPDETCLYLARFDALFRVDTADGSAHLVAPLVFDPPGQPVGIA